jgi:signal transduction histidine kinase
VRRRRSAGGIGLRRTLAITSGAVTIMVVIGFLVPLTLTLRTIAYDQATDAASLQARSIAEVLLTNPGPQVAASVVDQADAASGRHVELVLPSGATVGAALPDGSDLAAARRGISVVARMGGGAIIDVPVRSAAGTSVVRVQVPASQATQGVAWAWIILGLVGIGLVALAMIVGDRLARSITRPVARLEAVATTLSQGRLDVRAEVEGPKEVQSVANAVNQLGARIAALLQAERESAADLSHRLRTPLTALRLHIDGISDPDVRDQLIADSGAIASAVDEIIRTARATPSRAGGCELAETVTDRMRFWRVLAEAQHRSVDVEVPDADVPVGVAAADLVAALDALVTNVLTHTPEPGGLEVRVGSDGRHGHLTVEDRGPGLDASLLARGRSGAGGTGLGLDIARRTAEGAGGELRVATRPGGGASIQLRFPLRPSPPHVPAPASAAPQPAPSLPAP